MIKNFLLHFFLLSLSGETFKRRGIPDDANEQYKNGDDVYRSPNVEISEFNWQKRR